MNRYAIALLVVIEILLRTDGPRASMVLLYVGPDQILPLTSFLGAVLGIVLMCWRYLVDLTIRVRQRFTRHRPS